LPLEEKKVLAWDHISSAVLMGFLVSQIEHLQPGPSHSSEDIGNDFERFP